jgi:hypothetical protein
MDYAKRVREALRVRCVHLKTKASFLGLPSSEHQENPFDTATWWCEATCRALGPDGSTAHPSFCDPTSPEYVARPCYVPPRTYGGGAISTA